MRTFFVKVGRDGVPAENLNPRIGADWEQGEFIASKAKRQNPNPRGKPRFLDVEPPQDGDLVYVWVNQDGEGACGGLTATGTIKKAVKPIERGIAFALKDVKLLGPPFVRFEGPPSSRKFARGGREMSEEGFLMRPHHNRHFPTCELEEDDINDIERVLKTLDAGALTADDSAGEQSDDQVLPNDNQMSSNRARRGSAPEAMRDSVLFVRVGYMHYYNGPQPGDEKPKHGGSWNEKHVGLESYNFRRVDNTVYGYAQPLTTFNLGRIDPTTPGSDFVDNVLVIFVAKKEPRGQVIIGWYRKAKVFRRPQAAKRRMDRRNFTFFMQADQDYAVLLPEGKRTFPIPSGRNAFGQANVVYGYDARSVT